MTILAPTQLESGSMIGGYEIAEVLGRGAFGAVYRARQLKLEREVAIKIIANVEGQHDEELSRRFLREVDLVRRLEHPNIVRLYDFGETEDGLLWMAMELVRGVELSKVLEQERMLDPQRAHHIALQVLDALTEAHGLGIVHRDLKPANIMLTSKGAQDDVVKLLDFGVGKALNDSENPALQNLTGAGEGGFGTPRYMAPEYLKGEPIGPYTDVYAVGLVVYEMLVGEPAVSGDRVLEILSRQLTRPLALPAWLHGSRMGLAISRASAKASRLRYPSALEFFRDIENIPRDELRRIGDARAGRSPTTDVRLKTGPLPVEAVAEAQAAEEAPAPVRIGPPPLPGGARETIQALDRSELIARLRERDGDEAVLESDETLLTARKRPPLALIGAAVGVALVLVVVLVVALGGGGEDDAPGTAEASSTPEGETSAPSGWGPPPEPGGDDGTQTLPLSDPDSEAVVRVDSAVGEDTVDVADGDDAAEPVAPLEGGEATSDAAASEVAIQIVSSPAGAAVFDGREKLCEATPCTVRLAAGTDEKRLRLRLKGHQTTVAAVLPDRDRDLQVELPVKSADDKSDDGKRDDGKTGFGTIKIP